MTAAGQFLERAYELYERVDSDDEEALTEALTAFVAAGDALTDELAAEILHQPARQRVHAHAFRFRFGTRHHRRAT